MIYHVKDDWNDIKYSSYRIIQLIIFLNRLLASTETRYWLTKLKTADIVWVLRKIHHFIEFSTFTTIIYIDHDATLDILKQISMIIISIDKLNLRLMCVLNYIQRFNLKLRHKSEKTYIIFNALLRLISTNVIIDVAQKDKELNVLFIIMMIDLNEVFRKKIIENYATDLNWKKISQILSDNDVLSTKNRAKLSFYRKNGFIFRSDNIHKSHWLCISWLIVKNILETAYDDTHFNFVRCYDKMISFYYIRDLIRYLCDYLRYCLKCQIYQIRRHKSYDSLQLISTSSMLFHIITIDFVLVLFIFEDFNYLMSITCKHSKRVLLVSEKINYTVTQ